MEQNWKRTEYASGDEAFRGLSPIVRQQSVRVAAYTQVLFVTACKLRFGVDTKEGEARMRGQYADLSYKCGIYHQIGKALVPHEYQIWQEDFTEEEKAVYKKYTTDGRLLIAALQGKSIRAQEKRTGEYVGESPTRNVSFLMLREACEQHMERFDGSGYPAGMKGTEISPIAQIVGLAKELDRLASETKSEDPFTLAVETIRKGAGSAWSPELVAVLDSAQEACLAVYQKYIEYTRTLPKTIPLIDKRENRPMGLSYRPMVSDEQGTVKMYEATPWFGGVAGAPGETETAEELRELFKRLRIVEEVSRYFLYEATDALVRIDNCKLAINAILLNMLPDFYLAGTQLQKLLQVFVDQKLEKERLWMTVSETVLKTCSKTNLEIIRRYPRNGFVLVVDGYHPDELAPATLLEYGIRHVRIAPELYMQQDTANRIRVLEKQGFTVIGGNADSPEALEWLCACGVCCSSGTMTGIPVSEDELILDSLAREQK